jgi:PAS domain S-box-containing protein
MDPEHAANARLPGSEPKSRLVRLSRPLAYAAGAGCGLAAMAARFALEPIWGLRLPFILFYPAVMFAAWLGGFGAGFAATAIGAAAATYFWLPPVGSFRVGQGADLLGLAVFVTVGALISALEESRHRAIARNLVTEESLHVARSATDLANQRLSFALEASPAAMLIFDAHGTVIYANSSAHRLLGYPPGNLVGVEVEQLVPAAVRGLHAGHRRAFLEAPRPRPMGAGRELFAVRSDGVEVPVEIGLSPFENGGETFVLAAVSDISMHRAAEAARAALLVAERESSRRKDEFLATLSHELRNPLAPLRSAAGILSAAEGDPALTRAARQIIERQTTHLVRLVDDLLDLSRIGQNRLELRPELVDLSSVVSAAVEASRPAIEERKLGLVVAESPERLQLRADPIRLAQVLTNILNNAAKYTPSGGEVRLATRRSGATAEIRIRDTGVGMSPETLEKLFEMFYRSAGARALADGLGVGLALARYLVELHGGVLSAHSDGPGAGSEFVVTLPIEP